MKNLLKLKSISPIGKLIIMDILGLEAIDIYNKTSQDIANSIGCKRKDILIALGELEENGYIKTTVVYRSRITKITKLLSSIIE